MYDLAIIGLGPAGLEAAKIAIENNLNVIAFEKEDIGGTCLNVGCVPTKAIIHSSEFYKNMRSCSSEGINLFANPNYDWQKILAKKTNITSKFINALDGFLSKKITLIKSQAALSLVDTEIDIYSNNDVYRAKNIIVATGSQPIGLKGLKVDGKFVIFSDDFYKMQSLPKSILIVGSGAIGLEWAKILSDLEIKVTLIEKAPSISPKSDIEIQKRIERILRQNNIIFYKNDYIKSITDKRVTLNSGDILDVDCILLAIGREPVYPKIKVCGCKEEFKLKAIYGYETDIENLYLIGDATSESQLAHAASYQARCVMNKILFNKRIINKYIPSVIYLTPEVASIGIREQDIEDESEYIIKRIQMGSIAKPWCDSCPDGIIKVIIKDDLIKGAHIISKNASEVISLFSVFMDKNIKASEIQDMVFPHPSYSEAILEVLRSA